MFGFYGRILTVDLSNRTFSIDAADPGLLESVLGGKGLGTALLLSRNPAGTDPLGPDNRLIFATGPFCGGPLWGGSRYGVFTKSPLTGFYAESYSGGKVPEAIDRTGFDAVVVEGASERPVALRVHPDGCTFHEADHLWGLETYEAERAALGVAEQGWGAPGAVVIGPAGERLVRFALIANDSWRCAGRAGVGAVMGSKKLKAVVFQGDRKRLLADPKGARAYAAAFARAGRENKGVQAYKAYGTTMMVALMNTAGAFPAKYWSQGSCAHWPKISGETFHKEHDVTPHACLKCFMACGRMARLSKGRHQGLTLEGPEYETIYAFGGLCMIEEMDEIVWLNDLCDRLGLDTISAGNLCALAIEACRRGVLKLGLDYGDYEGVGRLIHDIANRKGVGELMAQGIVAAAEEWGLSDLAVHVKGMEPPGYDPRALKGMGLAYGTSPRGACHLRTTFYKPELAGMIPPDAIEGKAEMLTDFEDRLTLFDTLILCRFYRDMYTWEELEKAVGLATGLEASRPELRRKAALVLDLTREFNLREGLTAKDDRLPSRLHREALPDGRSLTEAEMETLLSDYYRLRGWTSDGRLP
ncbi:putative oxidoreductase YdhV [Fundidesulfovibrio magnetotacticus]|uniref:Putative oxidoreductase YdhV n=1 Tax=Fundidesulfovibrio magnetotacticus TaxID=2730080 RepID=A0A6V8LL81_9BACT|nr:aldehyde ferredoxin oxidoreductase family protein [Fundidesulfovibrio magnetotacticus]GFK93432.1 putative oxidoreductase YdhV [Fundidesulfovibrio magnetotacticus]